MLDFVPVVASENVRPWPNGLWHLTTDQEVGGSSPSGRAKIGGVMKIVEVLEEFNIKGRGKVFMSNDTSIKKGDVVLIRGKEYKIFGVECWSGAHGIKPPVGLVVGSQ